MSLALAVEWWSLIVSVVAALASTWAVVVARAANQTARDLAAEDRWWAAWERLLPLGNAVWKSVRDDEKVLIRDAAEALAMALPRRHRELRRLARDVARAAMEQTYGKATGSFLTPENPLRITVESAFPSAWSALKDEVARAIR